MEKSYQNDDDSKRPLLTPLPEIEIPQELASIHTLYNAINEPSPKQVEEIVQQPIDLDRLQQYINLCQTNPPLIHAVHLALTEYRDTQQYVDIINALLQSKKFPIDEIGPFYIYPIRINCTPLFAAIAHEQYGIANLLLEYGANINALHQNHETIAHYAARKCNKEMLGWLTQYGANLTLRNADGKTPRDLEREAECCCCGNCVIL